MNTTRRSLVASSILGLSVGFLGCDQTDGRLNTPEQVEVEEIQALVLTPDARLPEQDPAFERVEVFPDHLIFHYRGNPAQILAMENVVSGVQSGGYLRRITEVTNNGDGSWTVQTIHAELGELISEGHFSAHMVPGTNSFHQPGLTTAGLDWSLGTVDLGACSVGGTGSVEVTPSLSADFSMDVDIDIDPCIRRSRWGIPYPAGCFNSAQFIANGSLSAGVELETSAGVSLSCERDLIPEATANRLKREWTTTFAVGPVPIVLTHTLSPTASLSASGSVTRAATMGVSGRVGIRAGAEYSGGQWRRVWTPTGEGSAHLSRASCIDISVSTELTAGIEYELKIYDAAGPSISYGPQVSGEFNASFSGTEWTAEVSGGLGGSIGASLEVPVIDVTLAEISWDLPSATLFERMASGPLNLCADAGTDAGRRADAGVSSTRDAGMSMPSDAGVRSDTGVRGDAGPNRDGGMCSSTLGTSCTADTQCCSAVCDVRGGNDVCCRDAAQSCTQNSDCCGAMACTGGRCTTGALGAPCERTADCRSSICRVAPRMLCPRGATCTCSR
jgi:hypothetical protein